MNNPKPDRIAEIRARLDAATPGEWCAVEIDGHLSSPTIEKKSGGILARMTHYHPMRADAELIAHAPADLRFLLEQNERLRAALEIFKQIGDMGPEDTVMTFVEDPSVIDYAREALAQEDSE